jgi:hypothetical protein
MFGLQPDTFRGFGSMANKEEEVKIPDGLTDILVKGAFGILSFLLCGSLVLNCSQAQDNKTLNNTIEKLKLITDHQRKEIDELRKKHEALKRKWFQRKIVKELEKEIANKEKIILELNIFLQKANSGNLTLDDEMNVLKVMNPATYKLCKDLQQKYVNDFNPKKDLSSGRSFAGISF